MSEVSQDEKNLTVTDKPPQLPEPLFDPETSFESITTEESTPSSSFFVTSNTRNEFGLDDDSFHEERKILRKEDNRTNNLLMRALSLKAIPKKTLKKKYVPTPELCCHQFASHINKPDLSDFCFIIENKKIYSHRFILGARIPYFNHFFMQNHLIKELEIPEISRPAMDAFLKFTYASDLEFRLSEQVQHDLRQLCSRFEFEELEQVLEKVYPQKKVLDRVDSNLSQVEPMDPKMIHGRKRKAEEILTTERSYVKSLDLILNDLMIPLKKLYSQRQDTTSPPRPISKNLWLLGSDSKMPYILTQKY